MRILSATSNYLSFILVSILAGFVLAPAFAKEPCHAEVSEVKQLAAEVEAAFLRVDVDGVVQARARLDAALPCVSAPIPVTVVGLIHRAEAVAHFLDGDLAGTRRAYAAVKYLDPAWRPPVQILGDAHPLLTLFRDAGIFAQGEQVVLDWSPMGGWRVDGLPPPEGVERVVLPTERAFLLQAWGRHGKHRWTGEHLSAISLPIGEIAPISEQPAARHRRRARLQLGLGLSGVALAVAGAVGLGVATKQAAPFRRGDVDPASARVLASRANALGTAGWTALGLGVGLGVVGVSVPW